MTKKITFICLLITLITSCSNEKVIFYEYNGVTITRVENGNLNYFYYGRFDKREYPENYIISEYSGLNSGMQAYLIFNTDNTVEILNTMAYFNAEKSSPYLFIKDNHDESLKFWKWKDSLDKINGCYENVIEVNSALKLEQKRNNKNKSKVKAIYL